MCHSLINLLNMQLGNGTQAVPYGSILIKLLSSLSLRAPQGRGNLVAGSSFYDRPSFLGIAEPRQAQ